MGNHFGEAPEVTPEVTPEVAKEVTMEVRWLFDVITSDPFWKELQKVFNLKAAETF